jgi:DNA-binding PadR family transcriptional regulator
MRRRGWVNTEWRITENNRRARYYVLTSAGRCQLGIERAAWVRTAAAINAVLTGDWSPLPEPA